MGRYCILIPGMIIERSDLCLGKDGGINNWHHFSLVSFSIYFLFFLLFRYIAEAANIAPKIPIVIIIDK